MVPIKKPRLSSVLVIVFAALGAGGVRLAHAGGLTCGSQPAIIDQAKSAIKAKVDLILQAPPNTNMRGLISARRHALHEKFTDVEPLQIDAYLLWMTCKTLSADPEQSASQKFDKYAGLYRLLSEPIKAPSHPE
jgi:hypothetical protein